MAYTEFLYSSLCFYVYLFADPSMVVYSFRHIFFRRKIHKEKKENILALFLN